MEFICFYSCVSMILIANKTDEVCSKCIRTDHSTWSRQSLLGL